MPFLSSAAVFTVSIVYFAYTIWTFRILIKQSVNFWNRLGLRRSRTFLLLLLIFEPLMHTGGLIATFAVPTGPINSVPDVFFFFYFLFLWLAFFSVLVYFILKPLSQIARTTNPHIWSTAHISYNLSPDYSTITTHRKSEFSTSQKELSVSSPSTLKSPIQPVSTASISRSSASKTNSSLSHTTIHCSTPIDTESRQSSIPSIPQNKSLSISNSKLTNLLGSDKKTFHRGSMGRHLASSSSHDIHFISPIVYDGTTTEIPPPPPE